MEKLFLELVSPEREVASLEIDEIVAPGVEGDFGILPGHTPFLSALRMGELVYKVNGVEEFVAVDRGFLEVNEDRVIVLAEGAEMGREIDLEQAIQRKLEAEKALSELRAEDNQKFVDAEAKLIRELVRVAVAEKYQGR